ncbi:type III polyketide synthase [Patulibacter minatonensis]|uniref:type III polyketide synthase n=1 Tax=Patulibacter minatonensis TaxID=298163 RepID=UPI001B7FB3E5|nr:3-oxoacyl-[acyl-carrier-protein] synthase III C-terminal domain-containing protein [Patulibacter minatonensis]
MRTQTELWNGFFRDHFGGRSVPEQIFMNSGVDSRHGIVDPFVEDVREWGTEKRMQRFQQEALPLGLRAVEACLEDAGVDRSDVGQLTVVSCTGYGTPGVDVLLARDLGLGDDVQRLHIGHMGCYAAVPGLATVADATAARGKVSIMLCLELTSLHLQPPTRDLEQVVAHALFSDAAVAVAVVPDAPEGFEVLDVVARTAVEHAQLMRWDVTDLGFRMGLSSKVPRVLEEHVAGVVEELLAPRGLTASDVAGWAVHPGGPRIIDVVCERLGLPEEELEETATILREHGNCSSPTVLMVLERIRARRDLKDGDPVVFMAFGPGLTLYAALLRYRA